MVFSIAASHGFVNATAIFDLPKKGASSIRSTRPFFNTRHEEMRHSFIGRYLRYVDYTLRYVDYTQRDMGKEWSGHDRLTTTAIYQNLTNAHIVEEYAQKW